MRKYLLFFIFILLLSCNKDLHKDIPEFPKFKNNTLKFVLVDSVQIIRNKKGFYLNSLQDFNTIIQDSTLFIRVRSSFCNNCSNNDNADLGMEGNTNLIIIKNGSVLKHIKLNTLNNNNNNNNNITIDGNSNLIISSDIYLAQNNYTKTIRDTTLGLKFNLSKFERANIPYQTNDFLKQFDSSYINSKTKIKLIGNPRVILPVPETEELYIRYYQLTFKNKTGKTKIDETKPYQYNNIFKLGKEIYCINYEEVNKAENIKTVRIYKIE